MPRDATVSAATSLGRSRFSLGHHHAEGGDHLAAATDRDGDRAGAEAHLLDGRRVVVAQHLGELAAQAARLGDRVRRDPRQVGASTRAWTSAGACASSTLPTPVACIGSRDPTVLTTGTDALPRSRSR